MSEALPYMQRFRATVVVKFGGSIMENEDGVMALQDIAFMECVGMHPIVVHGGESYFKSTKRKRYIFKVCSRT